MRRHPNSVRILAMAGTSLAAVLVLAAAPATAQTTAASQDETESQLDEIVVTGTSIRGVPPTGSNLISLSRSDIETLGAANTPDLLASVPQLNSFNTAPSPSLGGVGSFAPGMRNLPANATLAACRNPLGIAVSWSRSSIQSMPAAPATAQARR